jgi:DUF971 family protein
MPTPTTIRRPQPYLLTIDWSDGFSSTITLRALRDGCPCAACKGETIMGTHYSMGASIGLQVMKPGMYELVALKPVGNYALEASWGDGHNTGIYSWDILRALAVSHALSAEELDALSQKAVEEGR